MLVRLLESELANHYRSERFESNQIDKIIATERNKNKFQNEAEDLLNSLDKSFFQDSINSVFAELKADNQEFKNLLTEKRILLEGLRNKFDCDFHDFIKLYHSIIVHDSMFQIESLQLELNVLNKQKVEIERIAEKKASFLIWVLASFNFLGILIWAIIIFIFSNWNAVEPVTWLLGLSILFVSNFMYAMLGDRITPEKLKNRRFEMFKHKLYAIYKFDSGKCELLSEEIKKKKAIVESIK